MKRHIFAPHLALADKLSGLLDRLSEWPTYRKWIAVIITIASIFTLNALLTR